MLIQNLLLRPGNNALQDAGDLDGQIERDFSDLAKRLRAYQAEHLDAKVKDRSNHYEQWSEENAKKIAYADRVAELAVIARAPEPMKVPARLSQDDWDAMGPAFRHAAVMAMAARETARIRQYLDSTLYAEKQSFHPDDWYLWSVAACRALADGGYAWDCWTLNLTTGGLNGGHYGLSCSGLRDALASKKGIAICRKETCPRNDEDAEDKED